MYIYCLHFYNIFWMRRLSWSPFWASSSKCDTMVNQFLLHTLCSKKGFEYARGIYSNILLLWVGACEPPLLPALHTTNFLPSPAPESASCLCLPLLHSPSLQRGWASAGTTQQQGGLQRCHRKNGRHGQLYVTNSPCCPGLGWNFLDQIQPFHRLDPSHRPLITGPWIMQFLLTE